MQGVIRTGKPTTPRENPDPQPTLTRFQTAFQVQPMDIELARWFRRSSSLPVVLAANKCEGGHRQADYVMAAMGEAYQVGFGEAVAISAETGEVLRLAFGDRCLVFVSGSPFYAILKGFGYLAIDLQVVLFSNETFPVSRSVKLSTHFKL